ncbi:flagellar protein FlgN [Mesobacillus zeae]|uniref:Flagellar protein FlgN n=1 Tax=Mesobacillus zeae TaxID=1917180 RepID=A0A398BB61_9BACI|nr:flagellar protein FlgN [Mesobacillus zeae]RID84863.1 flagellar protein FlgN [Mesobacillus zeae]
MSIEQLQPVLEKLLKLHKSLLELSDRKTGIVKKGDMDSLKSIIKEEQVHIAAIEKLNQERSRIAAASFPHMENASLTELAGMAGGPRQKQLLEIREELIEVISRIKEHNRLNQQLINQSLQFINFSRSLVMPQQDNYNYGPPKGKAKSGGQGLFNSKA